MDCGRGVGELDETHHISAALWREGLNAIGHHVGHIGAGEQVQIRVDHEQAHISFHRCIEINECLAVDVCAAWTAGVDYLHVASCGGKVELYVAQMPCVDGAIDAQWVAVESVDGKSVETYYVAVNGYLFLGECVGCSGDAYLHGRRIEIEISVEYRIGEIAGDIHGAVEHSR